MESLLLLASVLMNDDFPTFDLPAKAISGKSEDGSCDDVPNAASNSALFKFIFYLLVLLAYRGRLASVLFELYAPLFIIFDDYIFG